MSDKKISELTASTTPLAGTEVLPIVQGGATVKVSVANLTAGRDVSAKDFAYTGALTGSTGVVNIGSGQFYKDTTGKIGIKTANPVATLDVLSDTNDGIKVSDGTYTGIMYPSDLGGVAVGTTSSHPYIFISANAERGQFDTSGNLRIKNGNLVIGTAGKGIDFSADPNAGGMTSELLDDYEEGTFSAQITDGTNNAVMNANVCRYTKIGRQVFVHGNVSTLSVAGLSGSIFLGGLPFAISGFSAGSVGQAAGLNITAGYQVALAGGNGQTRLELSLWDITGGTTLMTPTEWSDDGNIILGFTYTV